VKNPMRVAIQKPRVQLIRKFLDHVWGNGFTVGIAVLHITFEVDIEEFEHEVELLVSMNDVEESDDVVVLQLFEKTDLPDRGTWNTFV